RPSASFGMLSAIERDCPQRSRRARHPAGSSSPGFVRGNDMRRKMLGAGTLGIALMLSVAVATAQDGRAGGRGQGRGGGRGPAAPPLVMTTTSFEDGGIIPAKFAGGMGVSPELKWTQVPMGT